MDDFWTGLAMSWANTMTRDVARYVVFAVSVWLVLYIVLGGVLAGRKILLKDEQASARQMAGEFLISIRSIAIFSTVGLLIYICARAGLMPLPKMAQAWGPVWLGVSLAAMIIAHDAYFYWAHRLMHRPRFFRKFHRRHHLSRVPTPFTAYSFDLREAAVMAAFVPAWLLIFPTPFAAVPLFMLHQIFRNTLGHAGFELMPARRDGRPLLDFLTTATHHNLHHAQAGWNHGLYFTWWDRWMGTEHPDYHAEYAKAVRKSASPGTGRFRNPPRHRRALRRDVWVRRRADDSRAP